MAIIEKIELKFIRQALKDKFSYILFVLFSLPVAYLYGVSQPLYYFLAFIFAVVFVVDLREYIIPDTANILLFITANILLIGTDDWLNAYLGACISAFIFGSLYFVYEKIIKKSALGFGDVKLLTVAGLFVYAIGVNYFLWILTAISTLAYIIRLFIKNKEKLMPYAPVIVISLWICILFKDYLDVAYYNIMFS